jgi:hypothetical protein
MALLCLTAACNGRRALPAGGPGDGSAEAGGSAGRTGSAGGGAGGDSGASAGARVDPGTGGAGAGGGGGAAGAGTGGSIGTGGAGDPGFVGMRRLSDVEYANSLQDLLGLPGRDAQIAAALAPSAGTTARPAGSWAVYDLDNLAGLATSPPRFQAYFDVATAMIDAAFAAYPTRARLVPCAQTSPNDEACTRSIISMFGLRAWRRPLTASEIDAFVALARGALTAGGDFIEAMRQVIQAMLVSESFLYRIELDVPPTSVAPHPLTSYDLATRLSYLLWSTTPDDELLQLAATDALRAKATLTAQATRLLADPRAAGFVWNFFGQWLGFRALGGAPLARTSPGWSPALQASMAQEAALFVDAVVKADHGLADLLTSDVNFVDTNLASLYLFTPQPVPGTFVRVAEPADQRKGYLGLAALLTETSHPDGTSATWRGRWVLEHLLCVPVPNPPPPTPATPTGNARERFATISQSAACAACHSVVDRVGFGLEKFDQIGRFRVTYEPGAVPIDDHGVMPDGTPFTGLAGLADLVAADRRFSECATRAAFSYAVGRPFTTDDDARVIPAAALASRGVSPWLAGIIVDAAFTTRRGEGP